MEQVYLRCSQGSLEWLYPTGAIIVNLRPNTAAHRPALHVCIKPLSSSQVEGTSTGALLGLHNYPTGQQASPGSVLRAQGSHVYLERAGALTLLLAEKEHAQAPVRCFSLEDGALFVEAVPATDISRRTTALRYELVPGQGPGGRASPFLSSGLGKTKCGSTGNHRATFFISSSCFASLPPLPRFLQPLLLKVSGPIRRLRRGQAHKLAVCLSTVNHLPLPHRK